MKVTLRALRYFRPDGWLIAIWLTAILLQVLLGLLQAWPNAILVDTVLSPTPNYNWDFMHRLFLSILPASMLGQVLSLALIGMAMAITQSALGWARRISNRRIELNGTLRARCQLYHKLQDLGPAYQHTQLKGDSIYRVSTDVEGCRIILNVLCDAGFACITLAVMGYIMLTRNGLLTAVAMSVVPLLLLANWYFAGAVKDRTISAKEADTSFTNALIRSISGIFVVQAFCRQLEEFARFRGAAQKSADSWQLEQHAESAYAFIVQAIFAVAGAVVFGYGGFLVVQHYQHPGVSDFLLGDLMVFGTYLTSLWDPLSRLTGLNVNLKPGVAGAERIFEVLDRQPLVADKQEAEHLPVALRDIAIENVAFSYPGGSQVLHDISATVPAGSFVAFVGASGTGKSTLLSLLARFYDPTAGAVKLGGHDLRSLVSEDARRHVALASQDSIMLPATVRENIAFANLDATEEQIREAARLSGADEFIERMEGGYNCMISENGQNLSGGQRQRIALARVFLSPAPIVVLDEPTSALDAEHEHRVLNALKAQHGKRTVILVTHNLASVEACDNIYVLEAGYVRESGTHDQLAVKNSLYCQLLRAQADRT